MGEGQVDLRGPMLTRRRFLVGAATAVALARLRIGEAAADAAPLPQDPFTLGVASGDPLPDGFVLWTRLAPDPTNGGGMPGADVAVQWEVATDQGFTGIVASGTEPAVASLAHSVHAEVGGLDADGWYYYRFRVEGWTSPVGRARTTPAAGTTEPLKFGFASCQSWPSGYYPAHRALAEEGCDLVFFLGDYIYENGSTGPVRSHGSGECLTLPDYRNRYGLYKGDPNLQAAHQACTWVVTWDDHEVDNNYAGAASAAGQTTADFLERRAAAYQAWWEHQPVRLPAPDGPDLAIYRRATWGDLATFHVIDTRQYRSDQACGDDLAKPCDDLDDPSRTMLGGTQEQWLREGLASAPGVWQVLAQQVVFLPMPILGSYNMDQWDGYPAQRQRVWDVLRTATNPLVITGDIHAAGAGHLHEVLDDVTTPRIGTELVGTSISSGFGETAAIAEKLIGGLPWVEWVDARHNGYTVVDMGPDRFEASFRVVSTVAEPTATVSTVHTVTVVARAEPVPPSPSTTTTTTTSAPGNTTTAPAAQPVTTAADFTG